MSSEANIMVKVKVTLRSLETHMKLMSVERAINTCMDTHFEESNTHRKRVMFKGHFKPFFDERHN